MLLDVRMPDMDGFEVCRRLKADPRTADVPVIFMTAVDDTAHKVEGFGLGAVDYITKPIQREELLARIQHHLQLHRLQKELISKSEDLALKNAELEAYGHTIAHSLKTPLAAANRFLEILYKFKSDNLSDEQRHLLQQACDALAMTGEVVDALLLLSTVAQQSVEAQPLDMGRLVGQALSQLADLQARTQRERAAAEDLAARVGLCALGGGGVAESAEQRAQVRRLAAAARAGRRAGRRRRCASGCATTASRCRRRSARACSSRSRACIRSARPDTAWGWPRCSASSRSWAARSGSSAAPGGRQRVLLHPAGGAEFGANVTRES